jgi:integrase
MVAHMRTFTLLAEHFGGGMPLDGVSRKAAREWRLWLGDRLSESTVCKHVRAAKTIWRLAIDWEAASTNPFRGVRSTAPERDMTERRPLNMTEGEAMIAAAGPRWRAIVAVLWFAGLRRSEALRLRWDDVDLTAGRLVVRNPTGVRTTKAKTRIVRIEPRLAEILRGCRRTSELVAGRAGERSGLSHVIRTIGQRAGIAGVTPQVMRQARASAWAMQYPLPVVAAWMGHSPEVARRHYLGVPDEYYTPAVPDAETGTANLTTHGPERTVSPITARAHRSTAWAPLDS